MKSPELASIDRLGLMQTFVRIVEAGNLSAAAAQLGTSQPTVSRRLQALEHELGLKLLQRSTHVMKLTEEGERCYAHAKALIESWQALTADLRGTQDEPEGHLRVLVPHAFGQDQLVTPLTAYLMRYPKVTVEWLLHDRRPDFIAEGLDCAVRVGEVDDPGVVAIRMAEVPRIIVAAPGLIEAPLPSHPRALAHLPWLALRTFYRNEVVLAHQQSGETHRFGIRPRLSTDSLYALRNAAMNGLGVGIASAWAVADDIAQGRLVHVAPDWRATPLPVYLLYPYARFYPARLRLFLDAMRAAMPAIAGMERARPDM
ncbi:MAG: LysR family transcriptional regulator [Rhodocyclaceae bacterium]